MIRLKDEASVPRGLFRFLKGVSLEESPLIPWGRCRGCPAPLDGSRAR
jgi:hypothetical protein